MAPASAQPAVPVTPPAHRTRSRTRDAAPKLRRPRASVRPGRRSQAVLRQLSRYESRNVTYLDPSGDWPIVWERARGTSVWDADGRHYLDLTAAFGVAAAGHAHPKVVRAAQKQIKTLLHAMGDVHPHAGKAALAQKLSQLTFARWNQSPCRHSKTLFCNSGFEAVEAALKTAHLATGRPGIVTFTGAYHGLGYGALTVTHRAHFRSPFRRQIKSIGHFLPFPTHIAELQTLDRQLCLALRSGRFGAVLVEPIQARAGIRLPPEPFLPLLRQRCSEFGALLVLDEIYTGFGRTGRWFACEHTQTVPDLICLGKALSGGFPISACVGRADLMDLAWPASSGEAIHTSTFLGHPVGCAMALANLSTLQSEQLIPRSAHLGQWAMETILAWPSWPHLHVQPRGLGLMIGLELRRPDKTPAGQACLQAVKALLASGIIALPEGPNGEVLAITPPLMISQTALRHALKTLQTILAQTRP